MTRLHKTIQPLHGNVPQRVRTVLLRWIKSQTGGSTQTSVSHRTCIKMMHDSASPGTDVIRRQTVG